MPRPKINFTLKNRQNVRVQPRHLVIISSQEEGQCLITYCKKVQFALQMKKLQYNFKKLSASAFDSSKIALSLNQIGKNQRVFVINKQAIDIKPIQDLRSNKLLQIRNKLLNIHSLNMESFKLLTCKKQYQNKWCNQQYSQRYQQLINPILLFGQDIKTQTQECISLPFFKFDIPRFNTITLKYANIKNQQQYFFAQGFMARVIQHQIQHLNGKILLDWRINHGNIYIQKQVKQYFPKTNSIVQDFSKQLKEVFKEFPHLLQTNQYFLQQKQEDSHRCSTLVSFGVLKSVYRQLLSFQDDCITRIVKHFKKQFDKFHERVLIGQIRLQNNINETIKQKNSAQVQRKINKKSLIVQTDQNQGYLQEQYSKTIQIKKLQSNIKKQSQQQVDFDQTAFSKKKKKKGKK